MWPWEHVAVGYVAYSLLRWGYVGRPPRSAAVLAVTFGSLFPDLLDKPLGWTLNVLPSLSIGHSVLVAVPLAALVLVGTRRLGRGDVGVAFVVGHLLHIPCDAVYPVVLGDSLRTSAFLWPVAHDTVVVETTLTSSVLQYLTHFRTFLASPRGQVYLAFELLLLATAVALWVADGLPVLRDVVRRS